MAFNYIKTSELDQMLHVLKTCEEILKCSKQRQNEILFQTQFDLAQAKDFEITSPDTYYRYQYFDSEICIKYLIKQKCYVIYSNKQLPTKLKYVYLFNGYNYGQFETLTEAKIEFRKLLYEQLIKDRTKEDDLIQLETF